VEVIPFMTVFPHGVVLSDASSCIKIKQTAIWTYRPRSFTSGMPCLIVVAEGRFPSGNVDRLFCDDKVCRLSPLLSQDSKGGASGGMRWMVSIIA
jgi:hypothetical protein